MSARFSSFEISTTNPWECYVSTPKPVRRYAQTVLLHVFSSPECTRYRCFTTICARSESTYPCFALPPKKFSLDWARGCLHILQRFHFLTIPDGLDFWRYWLKWVCSGVSWPFNIKSEAKNTDRWSSCDLKTKMGLGLLYAAFNNRPLFWGKYLQILWIFNF